MRYLIIVSIFCVFFSCNESTAKNPNSLANNINNQFVQGIDNDLKSKNIYGQPKTINEYRLRDILIKGDENINDNLVITNSYSFNRRGNLTERKEYQFNNSKLNQETKYDYDHSGNLIKSDSNDYMYNYTYDGNNNKIEERFYSPKNTLYSREEFIFNDLNKLEKRVWYKANGEIKSERLFHYDSLGNKTLVLLYIGGKLSSRTTFEFNTKDSSRIHKEYDSNGKLKITEVFEMNGENEIVTTYRNESPLSAKSIDYYDKEKRHIKWKGFNEDGSLKGNKIIDYDAYGNIVLEDISTGNSFIDKYEEFEYKFDEKDNWVKRIRFKDQELSDITIRKIVYY